MRLQGKIKEDLTAAMKASDDVKKSTLRIILGEFARAGKKELPDDEVIGILKKLIKSEREILVQKGETTSDFIDVVEGYLPQMAKREDILQWIAENIDFADYKNKMQAMGPIMKHFGTTADGNDVKKILQEI